MQRVFLISALTLQAISGFLWSAPHGLGVQRNLAQVVQQEPRLLLAEGALTKVDEEMRMFWIRTQEGKEMEFSYTKQTGDGRRRCHRKPCQMARQPFAGALRDFRRDQYGRKNRSPSWPGLSPRCSSLVVLEENKLGTSTSLRQLENSNPSLIQGAKSFLGNVQAVAGPCQSQTTGSGKRLAEFWLLSDALK